MTKWVFFDLDNVIFNEEPCFAYIFKQLFGLLQAKNHQMTFSQLMQEREECLKKSPGIKVHQEIARRYLKEEFPEFFRECLDEIMQNFLRYNPLMSGIEHQIDDLSKNYSLGIIANHVRRAREALENLDLLRYFEIIAISEEMGFSKPSIEFFALALSQKQINPQNAVMIGDKPDVDILPAANLGMKTILLDIKNDQKLYKPHCDLDHEYLASLKRVTTWKGNSENAAIKASMTISSVNQISYAVKKVMDPCSK